MKQVWLITSKAYKSNPTCFDDWAQFQSSARGFAIDLWHDVQLSSFDTLRAKHSIIRSLIGRSSSSFIEFDTILIDSLRCALRTPSEKNALSQEAPQPASPKKPLTSADVVSPRKSLANECENGNERVADGLHSSIDYRERWLKYFQPNIGYAMEMRFGDHMHFYLDKKLYIFSAMIDKPLFAPDVTPEGKSQPHRRRTDSAEISFSNFDKVNALHCGSPQRAAIAGDTNDTTQNTRCDAPVHMRMMISVMSTRGQEDGINLLCGFALQAWKRLQFSFYGDALRRWNSSFVYKPRPNLDFSIRIRGNSITNRGTLLEYGIGYRLSEVNKNRIAALLRKEAPLNHATEPLIDIQSVHCSVSKGQCTLGARCSSDSLLQSCSNFMEYITDKHTIIPEKWEQAIQSSLLFNSAKEMYSSMFSPQCTWISQESLKGGQCSIGVTVGGLSSPNLQARSQSPRTENFYQLISTNTGAWSWRPRPFLSVVWD